MSAQADRVTSLHAEATSFTTRLVSAYRLMEQPSAGRQAGFKALLECAFEQILENAGQPGDPHTKEALKVLQFLAWDEVSLPPIDVSPAVQEGLSLGPWAHAPANKQSPVVTCLVAYLREALLDEPFGNDYLIGQQRAATVLLGLLHRPNS